MDETTAKAPDHAQPQSRLASALQLRESGNVDAAAAALRALLADHPSYLQAQYELGVTCYRLGRHDEAATLLAAVSVVNPEGFASDELYFSLLAMDPRDALNLLEPLAPIILKRTKVIHAIGCVSRAARQHAGAPAFDIDVVGDSHAVSNFATIPRCRVHWVNERTMTHVSRQPIDLEALEIAPGATVVAVFGEIDCRCHLVGMAEQMGTAVDALCQRIATRYVGSIGRSIAQAGAARAAVCSVLPPPLTPPPDVPTVGSATERRAVAATLNRALAAAAQQAGIAFLDISDAYTGPDGYLDPAQSDGSVHIDFRLTGPIAARLDALFPRTA